MSDLYELKSIDGKGLRTIAKKNIKRGTLILKEEAQISDDGNNLYGPEWIKSVWESFKRMDILDQEEYLKLSTDNKNRTSNSDFLIPVIDQTYGNESPSTKRKILESLHVFNSNYTGEEGSETEKSDRNRAVYIHSSRFNPSCQPNVRLWRLPNDQKICRATRKIKAGEELTYGYTFIISWFEKQKLNRKFRQKDKHDVICPCEFCQVEIKDTNYIEAFEALEKEELELKRLTDENEGLKGPSIDDLNDYEAICQNTMKQIHCYKNIYNLGKKNNVSWNYLYQNVIFAGGISTFWSAWDLTVSSEQFLAFLQGNGDHLLKEVEKLLNAAKGMDDALGATNEERFMWQDNQDQFERILSAIKKMHAAVSSMGSNI